VPGASLPASTRHRIPASPLPLATPSRREKRAPCGTTPAHGGVCRRVTNLRVAGGGNP